MPLFVVGPADEGIYPAVIVVHEIFGLNDHIKDVARRFAAKGMVAYAPDLFEGNPGLPEDRNDLAAMRAVWQNIPDATLIKDLHSVLDMAQLNDSVRADKVGVIGYCMGGAIAYMFACSTPSVAWVADYYGRIFYPQLSETKPKHPIDYTGTLPCPVLALFAGQDELITKEHVDEFRQRLQSSAAQFELQVYNEAEHAFFNDTREFYNKGTATDAWERTLNFISKHTNASVT